MATSSSSAFEASPTITVHWLERSRAQRVLWLLEECHLSYDVKIYKRVDGRAPAELRQIQPLGKSPVVTVKRGKHVPLVLAESGTIMEYFVRHYARHLAPQRYQDEAGAEAQIETEGWLRYCYYMHYAEGSLMSLLTRKHVLHGLSGSDAQAAIIKVDLDILRHLAFLEDQLASSPDNGSYLCGTSLSAADIMIAFPLMIVQSSAGLAAQPGLEAYLEHLQLRPCYEAAIKRIEEVSGTKYVLV